MSLKEENTNESAVKDERLINRPNQGPVKLSFQPVRFSDIENQLKSDSLDDSFSNFQPLEELETSFLEEKDEEPQEELETLYEDDIPTEMQIDSADISLEAISPLKLLPLEEVIASPLNKKDINEVDLFGGGTKNPRDKLYVPYPKKLKNDSLELKFEKLDFKESDNIDTDKKSITNELETRCEDDMPTEIQIGSADISLEAISPLKLLPLEEIIASPLKKPLEHKKGINEIDLFGGGTKNSVELYGPYSKKLKNDSLDFKCKQLIFKESDNIDIDKKSATKELNTPFLQKSSGQSLKEEDESLQQKIRYGEKLSVDKSDSFELNCNEETLEIDKQELSSKNQKTEEKTQIADNNYYTPAKSTPFYEFKTPSTTSYQSTPFNRTKLLYSLQTPTPHFDKKLIPTTADKIKLQKIQCSIPAATYKKTPSLIRESGKKAVNRNIVGNNVNLSSANKHKESYGVLRDNVQTSKENELKKSPKRKVQFSIATVDVSEDNLKSIKVKDKNFLVLNQLGRGGSSVVYHCYDPIEKSERAIKKVLLSDDQAEAYINEVNLLHQLQNCDRIIQMYDFEILDSEKLMYVVLEKGETDLSKIIKNLDGKVEHLPMYMLIFYWMEMLYAVKQIHDNGIIHSDLKPANFLKTKGGIKLIDFGIASSVQADSTSVIKDISRGSLNYISPEALNNEATNNYGSPHYGKPKYKISYKTDVWSLGCILYQLVYKRTPFQHIGHMYAKLSAILDPKHEIVYPEANWVPPKIINTMKACLRYEMRSRPSINELIKDYESIYY